MSMAPIVWDGTSGGGGGGSGTLTSLSAYNGLITNIGNNEPITTIGSIGLASISSGSMMANITNAIAPPQQTDPNAFFNYILGSATGMIMTRVSQNTGQWAGVAAGDSGTYLMSNGPGVDLSWETIPGGSSTYKSDFESSDWQVDPNDSSKYLITILASVHNLGVNAAVVNVMNSDSSPPGNPTFFNSVSTDWALDPSTGDIQVRINSDLDTFGGSIFIV